MILNLCKEIFCASKVGVQPCGHLILEESAHLCLRGAVNRLLHSREPLEKAAYTLISVHTVCKLLALRVLVLGLSLVTWLLVQALEAAEGLKL